MPKVKLHVTGVKKIWLEIPVKGCRGDKRIGWGERKWTEG